MTKMTEKRFNSVGSYLYDYDKPVGSYYDPKFRDDFPRLLNELAEENEQLKSSNMEYEDALARLEEKNQQLEQQLKNLRRLVNESYNTERTTLGKNVLKQLLERIE